MSLVKTAPITNQPGRVVGSWKWSDNEISRISWSRGSNNLVGNGIRGRYGVGKEESDVIVYREAAI